MNIITIVNNYITKSVRLKNSSTKSGYMPCLLRYTGCPKSQYRLSFYFFILGIICRNFRPVLTDSVCLEVLLAYNLNRISLKVCENLSSDLASIFFHGSSIVIRTTLQNFRLAKSFPSLISVKRKFEVYRLHHAPTHRTIYSVHSKFLKTGSVLDKPRSGRLATITTDENGVQTFHHLALIHPTVNHGHLITRPLIT